MPDRPLAVLAFSGGLDTTVILHWLRDERLGRRDLHGEPGSARRRPRGRGGQGAARWAPSTRTSRTCARELVDEFFLPVLQMHARYEGRYLLGTSIARIPTARGQMRYAKRIGGNILVHGSTGKGNDQVRFETVYRVLQEDPEYTLRGLRHLRPLEGSRLPRALRRRRPARDDGLLAGARHPAAQRRHRRRPALLAGRQRASHKLRRPRAREAGGRPPPGALHLHQALGPDAGPAASACASTSHKGRPVRVELLDEDRNATGAGRRGRRQTTRSCRSSSS